MSVDLAQDALKKLVREVQETGHSGCGVRGSEEKR